MILHISFIDHCIHLLKIGTSIERSPARVYVTPMIRWFVSTLFEGVQLIQQKWEQKMCIKFFESCLCRVLKAVAPGKRQWWRGCWGRDRLAGSLNPGIRSTGMALVNSVKNMSSSLNRCTYSHTCFLLLIEEWMACIITLINNARNYASNPA